MKKISQENFIKAWENRRLVAGALKAANVRQEFINYEDFFTEGVIIYAQMLESHPKLEREAIDKLTFRKIIWRTNDQLRRIKIRTENAEKMPKDKGYSEMNKIDTMIVVKNEASRMPEIERLILFEHLYGGKQIKELVKETGIPYRTLMRSKKKVIEKLKTAMGDFKHG